MTGAGNASNNSFYDKRAFRGVDEMDIFKKGGVHISPTACAYQTIRSPQNCRCAFPSLLPPQMLPLVFSVSFKNIRVAYPRSSLLLESWEEVPYRGFDL